MFNSATLAVMLLFILSAILFTSTTVSIAIYYARKKADTEEKTLITKNDYKKIILIFSIIVESQDRWFFIPRQRHISVISV